MKSRNVKQARNHPYLIETYLTLNGKKEEEFQRFVVQSEGQEVGEMLSIYEERGMVKGMRKMLLRQLNLKFGDLPQQVETRVRNITSDSELEVLLDRFVTATSLADMGLEEA